MEESRSVEFNCGIQMIIPNMKKVNPNTFNIGQHEISTSSVRGWFNNEPEETSAFHVFPNSTVYKIPSTRIWYSVIVFPSSPNKSQVRYDIYSSSSKAETSMENVIATQIERMVSTQVKDLELSSSSRLFNNESKGIVLLHSRGF